MCACPGRCPSSSRAIRPMRAAPAVCELLGPIMTGPIMSNRSIFYPSFSLVGASFSCSRRNCPTAFKDSRLSEQRSLHTGLAHAPGQGFRIAEEQLTGAHVNLRGRKSGKVRIDWRKHGVMEQCLLPSGIVQGALHQFRRGQRSVHILQCLIAGPCLQKIRPWGEQRHGGRQRAPLGLQGLAQCQAPVAPCAFPNKDNVFWRVTGGKHRIP